MYYATIDNYYKCFRDGARIWDSPAHKWYVLSMCGLPEGQYEEMERENGVETKGRQV